MATLPPSNSQSVTGDYSAISFSGNATVNVYQNVAPQVVDQATIRAAQEQLAALPIDGLPARSSLPSGSRMPFWANPFFVGHEADLQWLAQVLKVDITTGSGEGRIVAVTGVGGIGKTQLATEFVHRYGQYFAGSVFWLSFSDENIIATQVAECGRPGHLSLYQQDDGLPLDDQVRLVLGAWKSRLPRLLVFDNCEDEQLLARWRPPTGASRILITSRRAQWDPTLGVEVLPLGVLQRPESVQLLRKHIQGLQASDASLAAVATELGDLPLALHLAGSFLNRYRHVQTLTGYLAQLRETDPLAHPSLTSGGRSATAHEQHLSRTFAVSYRNLDPTKPTDALALTLLARAIYFAPGEPIPHDLLLATLDLLDNQDIGLRQAEDALIRLIEVGLVESVSDDGDIRLHRLVVAFLRKMISDPTAQDAVERALARNYEHSRAEFPPGVQRTMMLDQLVDRMRSFVSQVGYTSADILRLFRVGSEGYRVLALVAVGSFPDQSCFGIVLEAIRHSRSAFGQYYALLAARAMLSVLNEGQRDELMAVLSDETDNAYYIGQSTNRQIVRDRILNALQQSGGTRSFVSSSLYRQTHAGNTKDSGMRKLFVVTAGTKAAGVGQEIMWQMNARPQSDLKVMVRCIDTARLVSRYTMDDGEWFQMTVNRPLIEILHKNRANYPELNKLFYPGILPETTHAGGGHIRYNGSMAVMVNHDMLKKWLSANMTGLTPLGDNQTNFSVALIVSAVGATGSGSLEYLADVIAEAVQEATLPTPVHMNIFILQPGIEGVSQLGLANTLALYAELASSRLARNDVYKLYLGRIVMVGWGNARKLVSIGQLQETAASLIRLINDPVSDLPARYEELGVDLHVLRALDERTMLPTHLSSVTPVTISLSGLEELIIQRDAARLLNNLVFGQERSPDATRSDELFIGTLATSMEGDSPEARSHHLLQYLTSGVEGGLHSLRKDFQEQALHYLSQDQASWLERMWLNDKTHIVQQADAMRAVGHQLINEISVRWLHLRRDSMVADSTLSLSSLRQHYQRLIQILRDTLMVARKTAQTVVPDDKRVAARLQELKTLTNVARGRFFKRERQRAIENAVQAIQHNVRTQLDRQALPVAIEVLEELTYHSSERLVSLEAVLQRLERQRQTMDNWGSIASRELKVGITHPLELPALCDKKAVEDYYEQVSIFTAHSQGREKSLTEVETISDFRHWLSDQQNMDDLFKGDIDLLLPVAQKYARNKIYKEGIKYSVLDVLLQGGEEALQQRLADVAELAQPLVNFNHSFAPEYVEVWYLCAYRKDRDQHNMLQKVVDRVFPQGRCLLLDTKDPSEIIMFYSVEGLPMSAVQDLTGRCLEAFLAIRKKEWLNRVTDTTRDTGRNFIPIYSSRDAEERVIQQGIICKLCRSIGKDFSHYRDLPELKDCESSQAK